MQIYDKYLKQYNKWGTNISRNFALENKNQNDLVDDKN